LNEEKVKWRTETLCENLYNHPAIPQSEGIRTAGWKYIRYRNHPDFEELYDLIRDPLEEKNLASDERYKEQLLELRERCDQMIKTLSRD
jgi:arylsulfatase A-like enzyme